MRVLATQRQDLVPLAERMRYLLLYRLAAAFLAVVAWWLLPHTHANTLTSAMVGGVTVAYLLVALLAELLWRGLRRRSHSLFGATLLIDAVWLAFLVYATGGSQSMLRALIMTHVVVVCLLASFRTGVKITLWHSLLAVASFRLQRNGILHPTSPTDGADAFHKLILALSMLWLLAIVTSTFAAVNERELRRRRYDLEALARFAYTLEATTEPIAVANALVTALVDEFELTRAVVLGGQEGDEIRVIAHRGVVIDGGSGGTIDSRSVVCAARKTCLYKRLDPRIDPWLDMLLPQARNVIVIPLYAERRKIGALVGEYRGSRSTRVERRVVSMIERFVSQAALALDNAWLLERIQHLAALDGLTGVANRRSLDEHMAREFLRAARSGWPLSLVMVDIDHFKNVNDDHGHQVGDLVLQRVARQLSDVSRSSDVVARYGGEEFALLLPGADSSDAAALAERIRKEIETETGPVPVTVSIGVATMSDRYQTATDLAQEADRALYESKRKGRNRVTAARVARADAA